MKIKMINTIVFAFIISIMIIPAELKAQIEFSPSVVFINPQTRTTSMKIKNISNTNKEVEISFRFGYAKYDSSGKPGICYNDKIAEKKNSIADQIKPYPKKFIIGPQQEQTVRFLVTNVNSLNDGTYWTRVVASAKDEAKQLDSASVDKISARISIVVETINVIFYQKGEVNTGLNIKNLMVDSDSVDYILNIQSERTGNSPFFGTYALSIFNQDGDLIKNLEKKASIYYSLPYKFRIPKNEIASGEYQAILEVNNVREDITEIYRLPFKSMTKNFSFTIP